MSPALISADDGPGEFAPDIVPWCPAMRAMLDDARRGAATDTAVLITGASGAGKDLLARAIHRASTRADRPLVAARGADVDHAALFRDAEGGSVLLEDVDDLPPLAQQGLLRVLQERGDVRVLSATRADLEARVAAGTFHADLLQSLGTLRLRLPSLSERREDIPSLVEHRLRQLAGQGQPRRAYSTEAMATMAGAPWPGNVRQLFDVVEQHTARSPGRVISAALVRRSLGEGGGSVPTFDEARADFVRGYLRQVLDLARGNISRAARLAGRNRTDLYKLLRRHGIDPQAFKRPH